MLGNLDHHMQSWIQPWRPDCNRDGLGDGKSQRSNGLKGRPFIAEAPRPPGAGGRSLQEKRS